MSLNLTEINLPRYGTIAECDAALERGENAFVYSPPPGFVEPTPPEAPHQPGSIVYVTSLGGDGDLPRKLINTPLTVVSCTRAPVDDAEVWDMELKYPDGTEVEFLILDEDVTTTKPF